MKPRIILPIIAIAALLLCAIKDSVAGEWGDTAIALLAIGALAL
jgi:hypothetical protein